MYRYAFQNFNKETMARAVGTDLPVSMKNAAMVCNAVRGKPTTRAKKMLNEVINLKFAIKFTRFNMDRGHKKKIGPGKYPVKTCQQILAVLENAEANANQKNLGETFIKHTCAHVASKPFRYGRYSRRKMKRAHVEIVLEEIKKEEKK